MSQNVESMIDVTELFFPEDLLPNTPDNTSINIKEIREAFEEFVKDDPDFEDKEYCFVQHSTDYGDERVLLTTSKPAELFVKPLVETAGKFYPSYIKEEKKFLFQESDLAIRLYRTVPEESSVFSLGFV